MALSPHGFLTDFTSLVTYPSRLLNQQFGHPLASEEIIQPVVVPRMVMQCPAGYLRNWIPFNSQRDAGSTVTIDKGKFQAHLDVQQFLPEEISVKISDDGTNTVIIQGKHEEKQDEHGMISRYFVRKYMLPKNCDVERVESTLSTDGVLTITAPVMSEDKSIPHKEIRVIQTGRPAKAVEKKIEEEEEVVVVKPVEEKKKEVEKKK